MMELLRACKKKKKYKGIKTETSYRLLTVRIFSPTFLTKLFRNHENSLYRVSLFCQQLCILVFNYLVV